MLEYYDRGGNPITLQEWSTKFEDVEYKRVAESHVGPLWVSTVWLGSDHRFTGEGPPIIFETMVFNQDDDNPWDEEICVRYCTEEEALKGHQEVVDSLQYVIDEEPTLI